MSLWKIAWRKSAAARFLDVPHRRVRRIGVTLMVAILVAGQAVRSAYESGPALNHTILIGPRGVPCSW